MRSAPLEGEGKSVAQAVIDMAGEWYSLADLGHDARNACRDGWGLDSSDIVRDESHPEVSAAHRSGEATSGVQWLRRMVAELTESGVVLVRFDPHLQRHAQRPHARCTVARLAWRFQVAEVQYADGRRELFPFSIDTKG